MCEARRVLVCRVGRVVVVEGEREVPASELEEGCGDFFDALARSSVGVTVVRAMGLEVVDQLLLSYLALFIFNRHAG